MPGNEVSRINPYSPPTLELERPGQAADSFPEAGIRFSGGLDLRGVRQTRRGSLAVGLILACSFMGMLIASAVAWANAAASVILLSAAALTALALWGFIHGQTERPLLKFDWMQGITEGTLTKNRLDIRWNDGESEASLLFPESDTDVDFVNRHGRLFVIRSLPCFVPSGSTSAELWQQIKAFRPPATLRPNSEKRLNEPPAPSQDSAIIWNSSESFHDDCAKHHYVCSNPVISRLVFIFAAIMLVPLLIISQQSPERGIPVAGVLVMVALFAGLSWMVGELRRRYGWHPNMLSVQVSDDVDPPPGFDRWIDSERLLVGYSDAWICVSWTAVQKVIISPHALQFSFTPLCLDRWFLERGTFTDEQWQSVINHIRPRALNVTIRGAVR